MARIARYFALALLGAAFAHPASGQTLGTDETGSLAISAILIHPLSISVTSALEFGRMFASTNKTIAPDGTDGGRVEISGEGGSAICVTLTMPTVLKSAGGTNIPIVGWSYVLSPSANLAATSPVSIAAGSPVPVTATLGSVPGVAKLYLGIGATVQASALAPTGSYTGTGEITVAYTDL